MQRSQILHRQLYYVACAIAPLIAGRAALKMPTAIVDHDERLFAFIAGGGHGSRLARRVSASAGALFLRVTVVQCFVG
jgi:hypothetical protein